MAKGFLYGNGGSGGSGDLNFRVIGGTSAPSNPKENDIWVNTDVNISKWCFAPESAFIQQSANLYPSGVKKTNYHISDADGTENPSGAYHIFDISLPEGTVGVIITFNTDSSTPAYHAFCDAGGNVLSTVQRQAGTNTYTAPNGAKKIRVSVLQNDAAPSIVAEHYAEVDDGVVYITTGTSGAITINALKKNGIQIYPLSAKQYVSGTWVDKTAKSYQGGKWVDWWNGELYYAGNEYGQVTGGWISATKITMNGSTANKDVVKNSDNLFLDCAGSGYTSIASTKNAIDISGYKTIVFDVEVLVDEHTDAYGIVSANGDIYKNPVAATKEISSLGRHSVNVDISSVPSGKYYVCAAVSGGGAPGRQRKIYSVKMVK